MDFLHKCSATIDYQTKVLRFWLQNEIGYEWVGRGAIQKIHIISNLKSNKMLSKGLDLILRRLGLFNKIYVLVHSQFGVVSPKWYV